MRLAHTRPHQLPAFLFTYRCYVPVAKSLFFLIIIPRRHRSCVLCCVLVADCQND